MAVMSRLLLLLLSSDAFMTGLYQQRCSRYQPLRRGKQIFKRYENHVADETSVLQGGNDRIEPQRIREASRRRVLGSGVAAAAAVVSALCEPSTAMGADADSLRLLWRSPPPLSSIDSMSSGKGCSAKDEDGTTDDTSASFDTAFPPSFLVYLARFLLANDPVVRTWWQEQPSVQLSAESPSTYALFGRFQASVRVGLLRDWCEASASSSSSQSAVLRFCENLDARFGSSTMPSNDTSTNGPERELQLALLFSLLPSQNRPRNLIRTLVRKYQTTKGGADHRLNERPCDSDWWRNPQALYPMTGCGEVFSRGAISDQSVSAVVRGLELAAMAGTDDVATSSSLRSGNQSALAEPVVNSVSAPSAASATLVPRDSPLLAINNKQPLTRERPLGVGTYAAFAAAGIVGCAGTHSVLVPIDVVKTRQQTSPREFRSLSLMDGAKRIVKVEGTRSLFAGFGPTVAGYAWYGLTVYPGYEFLKRVFLKTALDAHIISAASGDVPETVKVGSVPKEASHLHLNETDFFCSSLP